MTKWVFESNSLSLYIAKPYGPEKHFRDYLSISLYIAEQARLLPKTENCRQPITIKHENRKIWSANQNRVSKHNTEKQMKSLGYGTRHFSALGSSWLVVALLNTLGFYTPHLITSLSYNCRRRKILPLRQKKPSKRADEDVYIPAIIATQVATDSGATRWKCEKDNFNCFEMGLDTDFRERGLQDDWWKHGQVRAVSGSIRFSWDFFVFGSF